MWPTRTRNPVALMIFSAVLSTGQTLIAADLPDSTDVDEIVMYAVESSSPAMLMRYFFQSDTYVAIGEIWTADGVPVDDVEALSYVASGPYTCGKHCPHGTSSVSRTTPGS